ncbi:hypothetical protein KR52_05745 [Synechococcus sp. KORDI-52]|nr:hypothetical protein KR52_05745 [Synechococcus sp. KORDI-52]
MRQQQEDYAQEAWEREEARKEREAERSAERDRKQTESDEKKEREMRWDYETEGIRGGIESILKYRDPLFRLKLLEWHKEGQLRTSGEIEAINRLLSGIGDSIINEELQKILGGEYDNSSNDNEDNTDLSLYLRIHRLSLLTQHEVVDKGYYSDDVATRFTEVIDQYKEHHDRLDAKKTKQMLLEINKDCLGRLISYRKFPHKIVGGVVGWSCRDSLNESKKWWVRGLFIVFLPSSWFVFVPAYLLCWIYVSQKLNQDIKDMKRSLRRALLDAGH